MSNIKNNNVLNILAFLLCRKWPNLKKRIWSYSFRSRGNAISQSKKSGLHYIECLHSKFQNILTFLLWLSTVTFTQNVKRLLSTMAHITLKLYLKLQSFSDKFLRAELKKCQSSLIITLPALIFQSKNHISCHFKI